MPTPHYGQPRYRLIADELRRRIESGAIRPGNLLPTESALTAEFRASRGTIRQAIATLRDERLVVTEHGRGTYVNLHGHEGGRDEDSETATRQRQVAADSELAALLAVKVGTTLIEEQSLVRTEGAVGAVVRVYRLPRARQ
ncbi:GntR family transcriptional regulator [Micromonospora aurantiaca (nom. illeg.)]|uniref:GntR family transcriptional regulator n=1 Tax=Micromonospora aurantiaca (nom. illeg.) TaxID=47850 RepID=UPI00341AF657